MFGLYLLERMQLVHQNWSEFQAEVLVNGSRQPFVPDITQEKYERLYFCRTLNIPHEFS